MYDIFGSCVVEFYTVLGKWSNDATDRASLRAVASPIRDHARDRKADVTGRHKRV
jgi:hypothetical protein